MTVDEAIQAIKNELLCVSRQTEKGCERECGKCDLVLTDDVILSAYDMALTALRAQQEAEKAERLRNPCERCGAGWASASSGGVSHSCHETCEKFKAWEIAMDKEKNKPLTESELDSIKEAPLYIVPLEKEDALPGWCIYKSKNGLAVFRLKTHFNGMYFFGRKDYGKKWLAYRHPPKEAHDGADT